MTNLITAFPTEPSKMTSLVDENNGCFLTLTFHGALETVFGNLVKCFLDKDTVRWIENSLEAKMPGSGW